ncbi:MAG: dioxygenase [Acidimicrobiales bacterium]|nr:dioxygenase [Acidimicrobiales bacterium]
MTTGTQRQPAIYLPHGGGPWPFMHDPNGQYDGLARYLRDVPGSLPQTPSAVLVITAHWEAPTFTVGSGAQPELIYDYGGFPPHTYQLTYPAAGAPAIAARVAELATQAGIDVVLDPDYGWDHGVFVPIAVSWPDADVPVVAVSLKQGLDPAEHIAFGAAIEPLRDENVVIIGSGLSIHDLSFRITAAQATDFDQWLQETMHTPSAGRAARLAGWADAPSGRTAHPREEHLLPLMVVVGAGGSDPVERTYDDLLFGLDTAAYTFG